MPQSRTYAEKYPKRHLALLDSWMLLATVLLILSGLLALYSEGYHKTNGGSFHKQLTNVFIGIIPFLVFYKTPISFWQRTASFLYGLNLFLLVLVLFAGFKAGGAQRWVEIGPLQFQPSEASKLFTVLTLSAFYFNRLYKIRDFSTCIGGILHIIPPMVLVFIEPHLGATIILLVCWFLISMFAGVPLRFTGGILLITLSVLALAFFTPGILRSYQKQRIYAMFGNDEKGSKYQQLKSTIAFGIGGPTGTGFLKGQHKQGRFVPEQRTDFIFSVVGEEGGLIGSTFILILYGILFYRASLILLRAQDPLARMVASGVIGILAFHTIANLGMNLDMTPVVGLWLPFLSYGGTGIWLCLACIGLLLNIYQKEKESIF